MAEGKMVNAGRADGADRGKYTMKNGKIYEAVQVKQHGLFEAKNTKEAAKGPAGHQQHEQF